MGGLPADVRDLLVRVQNELFDVGADLCNPLPAASGEVAQPAALRIDETYITTLERACDAYNEGLAVLRSFVLPGGSAGAVLLHTARTVVRRAERSAWAAMSAHAETVSPLPARYLNRLSDLLFVLARRANEPDGDLLWRPGAQR
jgi:cob(I)alamin adenosyltransferase